MSKIQKNLEKLKETITTEDLLEGLLFFENPLIIRNDYKLEIGGNPEVIDKHVELLTRHEARIHTIPALGPSDFYNSIEFVESKDGKTIYRLKEGSIVREIKGNVRYIILD